jgi:lipopolysaccharide transport system permease protein
MPIMPLAPPATGLQTHAASRLPAPLRALVAPALSIWRHRRMLVATTRTDLRGRYAGSVLGLLWLVLLPLLLLGAYTIVYGFIFQLRTGIETLSGPVYIVLIFCGLIPFLGVADALGTGTASVTSNPALVKNTLFPIEMVPVKAVFVSQATQVVGLMLLMIAVISFGRLTWWALLLPVVWGLQVIATFGLIWILASINVFVRDLQASVGVVTLVLMMVSPIAYSVEMIPENLRPMFLINPMYYLIVCYQDVLVTGRMPADHSLWVLAGMALVLSVTGYAIFIRLKGLMADHV